MVNSHWVLLRSESLEKKHIAFSLQRVGQSIIVQSNCNANTKMKLIRRNKTLNSCSPIGQFTIEWVYTST